MTAYQTQARYYSSDAAATTLAASLGPTGNPSVNSIAGLPASYPYTMLIDWGLVSQEAISVTSAPTGTGPWTLPCTRGIDGSTGGTGGTSHASGAVIVHGVSAQDFAQPAAYLGGAGGFPWQFNVVVYGAKGDGQVVTDGSMSSSVSTTTLTCSTSTPFTAADVGKAIMVKGASSATGVTTLVTTIAAYTSSSVVTLSAACTNTVSGATVMWATDDTAAFQSAVTAAVTWAQANSQYAEVVVPAAQALFYGIAGALSHANSGNAQITLPVIAVTADCVTLVIRGVQTGSAIRHWKQLVPQTSGSTLVSFGVYASAAAMSSDITANGQPAMIGGPTGPNGYGTGSVLFSNMLVVLQGLDLLTTVSSYGLGYGVAWLWGVDQANISDVGYGTAGIYNLGGSGDYSTPAAYANGASIGIGMPCSGNQNNLSVERVTCAGGYRYGLFATEHCDIRASHIFYCTNGLCVVGSFQDGSGSATSSTHKIRFTQVGIENCSSSICIIGEGAAGVGPFVEGSVDSESGLSWTDNNSGTGLGDAIGTIRLSGTTGGGPVTTTSGTLLNIIDERQSAAPTTWSLTVGTAFQNTAWHYATVVLLGGTSLTTVQVASLRGGSSAPAMTTVYTQSAAALPALTVRVPPGGWLQVNGTGSPTAPTANVIFD